MNDLLTKLFVHVPTGHLDSLDSIISNSENNNKIYFVEELQLIVLKGKTYGVDQKTSTKITSLISAIGGFIGTDGTVTVDLSNLNYYTSEGTKTIIGAIKAIDAQLKVEMDKLAASKILGKNYEFTGKLKYVPAVKDSSAAYIVMTDEDNNEIANTKINISDIIGNGVLDHSEYVKETGILHLWFKQADGSLKDETVDLKAMLDIDDVLIGTDSQNYLKVTLGGGEGNDMVLDTKIVSMANAKAAHDDVPAVTGLADALDVKAYVDSKANDLSVKAQGDAYVTASIDPTDNKKVIVATNVKDVIYTPGTHATYDTEGIKTGEPVAATISGVANYLVDGAQAITAIKSYIDFVAAEEALRSDAKVLASIKALDKASATVDGSNVHVTYKEEDGIVTIESVAENYATVERKETTSSDGTPNTDAIVVKSGDEAKLVKASDLKTVADYAADKVTEEANRVDNLTGSYTGIDTGKYISVKVDSTGGKVTYVAVEFNPWETYGVTQSTN